MKAFLKNYRQSPRKVRLVAGLIKGKSVAQAIAELDFLAKRAGLPIKKLLLSAVANAKHVGRDSSTGQAWVSKKSLLPSQIIVTFASDAHWKVAELGTPLVQRSE